MEHRSTNGRIQCDIILEQSEGIAVLEHRESILLTNCSILIEGKNKGKASIFIKQKPKDLARLPRAPEQKRKKVVVPLESISDVELEDESDG